MCIITNVPSMCEELLNQRSVSLLNFWFSVKCFLEHFVCLFFVLIIAMFVILRFTSEICFETLVGRWDQHVGYKLHEVRSVVYETQCS
jgi:hypothetical protein